VVSGPALFFFGVEQGPAFASEAARAVLLSMVGVSAAGVSYAWSARRLTWMPSLLLSWAAFFVTIALVQRVRPPAWMAFLVACAAIAVGHALLPPAAAHAVGSRRAWDLPLRVAASMSLVLAVTSLAEWLGPTVSGALTPFPVAISVLLAFGHAQQGGGAAITFMRGFMPGMWSFAVFCYVISVGVVAMGVALGFTVATVAALGIQAAVLWGTQRGTAVRVG
jgi:hypothetical protein